ncbi:U-box domain-containing protein 16 [Phtheirospermum japonicum]|uniref:RING-type E3 ubiquitin transferase n=1 Tax=Phtheirospermum japonicum TaxID=374723 RepID=A0A830CJR6_9LAMI|nr:U-box domain-containing protein 16 [Phtheirospermum japonicum]
MAVPQESFPARKRRPSAGAFISPNFSDHKLLHSIFCLSHEISSSQPLTVLLKKNSASIIRKCRLISVLFEEFVRNPVTKTFPPSAALCFDELYIVLHRIKILLEDCTSCSKMWLLIQIPSFSNSFTQLVIELSTLLDIFPAKELNLNEDVQELLNLIKKQCSEKAAAADTIDETLRAEVLKILDDIKREIVPNQTRLLDIFETLNLTDSTSCSNEIENLEDEIQNNQNDDKSKADVIALIGLVRYGKCVLYGASSTPTRRRTAAEANFPADFRCPISLDLMTDPVVVSTGQTYDRSSINLWIESGHATCPKTGQALAHTQLIPNLALKNLIAMWCQDQRIPLTESTEVNVRRSDGVHLNKTAFGAVKMTVSFLVSKLTAVSQTPEVVNRLVHELRVLAKTDSDSRACIAEAGALPLLVKFLGPDNPNLQVNAVTTILNLSILELNKTRIMETDGVLNGVVDAVGKLVEGGVVDVVREVMMDSMMVEEAVAVLEAVVKRGGLVAVAAVYHGNMVKRLTGVLREGSNRGRECAAAILVCVCRKGGSEMVMELASITGIERVIWEVMGMGTGRAKRKAATLLRILRRWAAGLIGEHVNNSMTLDRTSTRIVLPA